MDWDCGNGTATVACALADKNEGIALRCGFGYEGMNWTIGNESWWLVWRSLRATFPLFKGRSDVLWKFLVHDGESTHWKVRGWMKGWTPC